MSKFEHSIPVPHFYKRAAKIVKEVKVNGANLKSLVYEEKRIKEIKPIYALTAEALQHSQQIEFLLQRTQLLEKEPRLEPWLARVLITELLWGKRRLPGESKPVKTLLAYEQMLNAHLNEVHEAEQNERKIRKPRYVRVNLLKSSMSKAITLFKEEGWIYVEFDKNDYTGFLERIVNLGKDEFMSDIHIEDLLVFPPGTTFHRHEAYLKGSIVLQDKASCLPVHILNPPPNATVLDMCAAPGMKTSHLAAKMKNKGLIYAVDIDAKRFVALKKLMSQLGVTCVKPVNKDVLSLTGKDCPGIEYILVDPSCSGSGIVDRLDFDYPQTQTTEERLKKLAGFQILMLKHALRRFPKAKRVVYSTCSVNPKENEAVVQEVLTNCQFFKLVPAGAALKTCWLNFGSPEFVNIGENCLYARPEVDQTNGFFIAVLERVTDSGEPHKKRNETKAQVKDDNAADENDEKRRKRKHCDTESNENELEDIEEQKPKKMVKVDEEMKHNKVKKVGTKNNPKRNKQKYLEINGPVKDKEESIIAENDVKRKSEKENEEIKTDELNTIEDINSPMVNNFEPVRNTKKLATNAEKNEKEANGNYEGKKEKRKKKKEIKSSARDGEESINPRVQEVKSDKKKKINGAVNAEETIDLKIVCVPEEEVENKEHNQKKSKRNIVGEEDRPIQNDLKNPSVKRKKRKSITEKNEEAHNSFENEELKKGEEEECNVLQIKEHKRNKKKKIKVTADDEEKTNLEIVPPFEDDAIKNNLNRSSERRKALDNFEEKIKKIINGTTGEQEIENPETEEEVGSAGNQTEKQKRKKKKKVTADHEQTLSLSRKRNKGPDAEERNQIRTIAVGEGIVNGKRPSAKRKKFEN